MSCGLVRQLHRGRCRVASRTREYNAKLKTWPLVRFVAHARSLAAMLISEASLYGWQPFSDFEPDDGQWFDWFAGAKTLPSMTQVDLRE